MGIKILVVSKNIQQQRSIFETIYKGCDEIGIVPEVLWFEKSIPGAIRKLNDVNFNLIICDINFPDWKTLREEFGKVYRVTKAFIVFGEKTLCDSQQTLESDGFVCVESLTKKDSAAKVCETLFRLVERKKREASRSDKTKPCSEELR